MKSIEVTLYDIFGYVFPGAIALLAVDFVAVAFAFPREQDWNALSTGGWVALLIVAYLLGHLLQGLANLVFDHTVQSAEDSLLGGSADIPDDILKLARQNARRAIGLADGTALDPKTLYAITDHYLQQQGKCENREIFVYREGFYRGLTVALPILALGCIPLLAAGPTRVAVFGIAFDLTLAVALTVGVLAIAAAVLSYRRFRRFSTYRVKAAFYGFLVTWK